MKCTCARLKFIILRKQKNERPQFISIQRRVSEEITMTFANYHDLETAKEQLKAELKTQVTTTVIGKILEQLQFQRIDVWGFLLHLTKPLFLKFSKGHKQDWCNKCPCCLRLHSIAWYMLCTKQQIL